MKILLSILIAFTLLISCSKDKDCNSNSDCGTITEASHVTAPSNRNYKWLCILKYKINCEVKELKWNLSLEWNLIK